MCKKVGPLLAALVACTVFCGGADRTQSPVQARSIEQLVGQLGSESYQQRDAAQKALTAMGRAAVSALRRATQDKDIERSRRAKAALHAIRVNTVDPNTTFLTRGQSLDEAKALLRFAKAKDVTPPSARLARDSMSRLLGTAKPSPANERPCGLMSAVLMPMSWPTLFTAIRFRESTRRNRRAACFSIANSWSCTPSSY